MPKTTPLKLAIMRSGMTQLEIAGKTNLAQSVLNLIVNGHKQPTSEQARDISRILRIPQRDLFDAEDPNG